MAFFRSRQQRKKDRQNELKTLRVFLPQIDKLESRLWLPKQLIFYCYQSWTNILQAKIYFYIVRLTDQFPINAFVKRSEEPNRTHTICPWFLCNSFGPSRWPKNTQNQIGICAFLIAVRTRECSKVAWQHSDFQLSVRDWRFAWGLRSEDILFSYCGKSTLPDKYHNNSTVETCELYMWPRGEALLKFKRKTTSEK